jgi:hypothetical protein
MPNTVAGLEAAIRNNRKTANLCFAGAGLLGLLALAYILLTPGILIDLPGVFQTTIEKRSWRPLVTGKLLATIIMLIVGLPLIKIGRVHRKRERDYAHRLEEQRRIADNAALQADIQSGR